MFVRFITLSHRINKEWTNQKYRLLFAHIAITMWLNNGDFTQKSVFCSNSTGNSFDFIDGCNTFQSCILHKIFCFLIDCTKYISIIEFTLNALNYIISIIHLFIELQCRRLILINRLLCIRKKYYFVYKLPS